VNFPYSNPGATSETSCYTTCPAGQNIPYYGAVCTPCPTGTYGSDHPTNWNLSGGSCTSCPSNYDDGGIGLIAISQCKWATTGGTYVATANATTATNCPAGYYCPSETIQWGNTGSRLECPNSPAGSSTADACTIYVKSPNGKNVRLHGSKQTSPTFNVITSDGTRYYGNMRTGGSGNFGITYSGTSYYLYY
jgi:hypothetical protein